MENFSEIRAICFTEKASLLCQKLQSILPRFSFSKGFGSEKTDLKKWTADFFEKNQTQKILIIFVGALGIAVRQIAPFLRGKDCDPAVLCIDEGGKFVISVLSGHIGGANRAAEKIAQKIKSVPVITTATDSRGVFASDSWAEENGIAILNKDAIKIVSAKILSGGKIRVFADEIAAEHRSFCALKSAALPFSSESEEIGVCLAVRASSVFFEKTLFLVPKIISLGIGCRKNTSATEILAAVLAALKEADILIESLSSIASVDAKKNERGIIECAEKLKIPFFTFSASELNAVSGNFSESAFVERTVGTPCVCERAAVIASESKKLILQKRIFPKITIALAK